MTCIWICAGNSGSRLVIDERLGTTDTGVVEFIQMRFPRLPLPPFQFDSLLLRHILIYPMTKSLLPISGAKMPTNPMQKY